MGRGTEPARRFAADRHPVRISAEMTDIVADPFECELLVHQPVIAGDSIAVQGRIGKPAERAEAIIDGDDNDPMGADQDAGVESRACTGNERAAVDEDPNGEPVVVAVRTDECRHMEYGKVDTMVQRWRKLMALSRTTSTIHTLVE